MDESLSFQFKNYDFEFSFEDEGDDGDATDFDGLLRIYCFNKDGEELASICSQIPIGSSKALIANFANGINEYLENSDASMSCFRTLEKFVCSNSKLSRDVYRKDASIEI